MKLLLKTNTKNYYEAEKEGQKIIVGVWNYDEARTTEELKTGLKAADIPSYLKPKYTIKTLCNEPLGNLFDLSIYKHWSELSSKNYNLFEYDYFIKGNKKANKSLKSACICQNSNENYFYIAIEPYDSEVTKEDLKVINSYVNTYVKEIEILLNKNYSHTEIY